MLLRTLLFGVLGAITGAIATGLAPWLAGDPPLGAIYWFWMCVVGIAGGVVGNTVNEYLGLYKNDSWQRFFARKRK